MSADVSVPATSLIGFLLVLVRISCAFVFVPWPGVRSGPEAVRVLFCLLLALALAPVWPLALPDPPALGTVTKWVIGEAAIGLTIGLLFAVAAEAVAMAAQMISLQAGFSYASTVDPASPADSQVLLGAAQMAAALLFFAFGLHHQVLRAFALSLSHIPPGFFAIQLSTASEVVRLFSILFSTALRLALPIMTLLLMVDLALALLGRVNTSLQLFTLAFPAKILIALFAFAALLMVLPRVFGKIAGQALQTAARLLGLPL
jgi:flagellar biosynthetic protein FliR